MATALPTPLLETWSWTERFFATRCTSERVMLFSRHVVEAVIMRLLGLGFGGILSSLEVVQVQADPPSGQVGLGLAMILRTACLLAIMAIAMQIWKPESSADS